MPKADPAAIELLILDVDGVLTDGRLIYTDDGGEGKAFNSKDGAGIKYWHRAGKRSAFLTGRQSAIVDRRGAELGVHAIRQGALVKLPVFHEILASLGVPPEKAAYMGDDLPDLPSMREAGLAITVADAVDEVKAVSDWVAPQVGGKGAARWAIERLLRACGQWTTIVERYA
jgi:3-deoxy-D-manno-octulosonate 8-phosphate phosphatase (KDO 8-P phosphatase)